MGGLSIWHWAIVLIILGGGAGLAGLIYWLTKRKR